MTNHGQVIDEEHIRKCNIHGEHGILYICESYPEDLKKELKKLGDEFCGSSFVNFLHNCLMEKL